MLRNLASHLFVLSPFLVITGCSNSGNGVIEDKREDQSTATVALPEVADMLRMTARPGGKGPSRLSDLNSMQTMYSRGYQAIKTGEVVVIWGVGVKGEGETAKGGEIVAYESKVPTGGGYVLLTSGEVKKMSADEFKSAPKAK